MIAHSSVQVHSHLFKVGNNFVQCSFISSILFSIFYSSNSKKTLLALLLSSLTYYHKINILSTDYLNYNLFFFSSVFSSFFFLLHQVPAKEQLSPIHKNPIIMIQNSIFLPPKILLFLNIINNKNNNQIYHKCYGTHQECQ